MIGILTFYWADDYGAMLQSYALKTYLNQYCETALIPYFPKPLQSRYRLIHYNRNSRLRRQAYEIALQLLPWKIFPRLMRKYNMCRFRRKYLVESSRILAVSGDISEFGREIDIYVSGSDQVWNPEITDGFQEGYFCSFPRDERVRCVAYAASIGSESLAEKYEEPFSRLLSNFDAISLREKLSVPFVGRLCDKKLWTVLDPVFLIGRQEWEALLCEKGKRVKKYIAVYYTEYNLNMAEYLRDLQSRTGFMVLVLQPRKKEFRWAEKERYAGQCGPLEFLRLIHKAEYVVTNSFHGTAFSIIFQKRFAVFLHGERGARLRDLLRISQLEGRLMRPGDGAERMEEETDWNEVDAALEKERRHSIKFIEEEILGRRMYD